MKRAIAKYIHFLGGILGKRYYDYTLLMEHLLSIAFYSLVPNDDNRGFDGESLREQYLNLTGPQGLSFLPPSGCSVLEMLVALAERINYDMLGTKYEQSVGSWFGILLDNIGLSGYTNAVYEDEHYAADEEVEERVKILLERRYSSDGNGGLFPLKHPQNDQRKVEIWYQMSAWENENFPI